MARVTVEDCIDKADSQFELVLIAGKRARQLSRGAALTIERDDDKNAVVALREIAEETIDIDELREEMVKHHQKHVIFDDDEEDEEVIELMAGEEGWASEDGLSEADLSANMQTEEMTSFAEDDSDDDFGDLLSEADEA